MLQMFNVKINPFRYEKSRRRVSGSGFTDAYTLFLCQSFVSASATLCSMRAARSEQGALSNFWPVMCS